MFLRPSSALISRNKPLGHATHRLPYEVFNAISSIPVSICFFFIYRLWMCNVAWREPPLQVQFWFTPRVLGARCLQPWLRKEICRIWGAARIEKVRMRGEVCMVESWPRNTEMLYISDGWLTYIDSFMSYLFYIVLLLSPKISYSLPFLPPTVYLWSYGYILDNTVHHETLKRLISTPFFSLHHFSTIFFTIILKHSKVL